MRAYRTHVVIKDPKQVVLADVPFQPGERVEVLLFAPEALRKASAAQLKKLLKATQGLPQVRALSEEDILAEVAAQRSGQ